MCDTLKQIDFLKKHVARLTVHIKENPNDYKASLAVGVLVNKYKSLGKYLDKKSRGKSTSEQ